MERELQALISNEAGTRYFSRKGIAYSNVIIVMEG